MLDSTLLVLALLVLCPAARFPGLLRWLLRLRGGLVAVAAGTAIVAGETHPLAPVVVLTLLNLYAFLELVAQWRSPRRGEGGRLVAWVAASLFWTLVTAPFLSARGLSPVGTIDFWLLGLFNTLYFRGLHPVLATLGLGDGAPQVLAYLGEPLAFLSGNLFGFVFAGQLVLSAIVYELLRGKAPELPARVARLELRWPRWVAVLTLAALVANDLSESNRLALPAQALVAMQAIAGLALLHRMTAPRDAMRSVFTVLLLLCFLHPLALMAPAALGVADSLLDLSAVARGSPRTLDDAQSSTARGLTALRRLARPVPLLVGLVVAFGPGLFALSGWATGGVTAPEPSQRGDPAAEAAVPVPGGALWIDVLEHPNRPGAPPTTGVEPERAEALCREEGKRLCARDAWAWSCSSAGRHPQLVALERDVEAGLRLAEICNYGSAVGLAPTGAHPDCRTQHGVLDLVGNAYEWVRLPDHAAGWGLVGAYFATRDDTSAACGFAIPVHPAQLDQVDLDVVGFRCCR